jgi:hypothetical protein
MFRPWLLSLQRRDPRPGEDHVLARRERGRADAQRGPHGIDPDVRVDRSGRADRGIRASPTNVVRRLRGGTGRADSSGCSQGAA